MSLLLRHPSRLRKYSTEETFYPRELSELNGKLYFINDDGSETILNKHEKTSIVDSDGTSIGSVDPTTVGSITLPRATGAKLGLTKLSNDASKLKAAGTASAGSDTTAARADHVHPAQTTITGNAATAGKLKTAVQIKFTGIKITDPVNFDGSTDVTIPVTEVPSSIVTGFHEVAKTGSYNDLDDTPSIPTGSGANPKSLGTASPGSSTEWSRADHVHPAPTTISGNAGSATKATNDSKDQNIASTYIKNLTVSGKVITFTRGDNTTGTITTQDTDTKYTLPVATGDTLGGVKSGTDITIDSEGNVSITNNSHTHTVDNITNLKTTLDSLTNKSNNSISGLSVSGKTITYTKTDGSTGTITTQDTNTWNANSKSVAGYVSAPGTAANKVWKTDSEGNPGWRDDSNTTYSAGAGIGLSGNVFSNSGVRSITSGSTNGTISVNTNGTSAEVAVKGLGSAAYTASSAYATSGHTHNYAGSSSAGGVANSAAKLSSAKTIAISGGATGTATSFNGTANITIPITSIDGSKITGTIPLSSIPKGAQERLVIVTDDTARLALTSSDAQNGDVVKVTSTGIMYYIKDDTKLGGSSASSAFEPFSAGQASSVDWSGVQNKPNIPQASSTLPLVASGSGATGTGTTWARADHVHPVQTTISGNAATATTATKLGTDAGSATQPIYFSGGKPVACSYTLGKSVPSNAVFTDTHYTTHLKVANSATGTADTTTALTNGNVYLNALDNTTVRDSVKITGSGATTVTTDANANIIISSTNTTYSAATTSSNGLMTPEMVSKLNGITAGANAYSHPTSSGNKHIPSGGSSGQILRWSADGTATWGADNNTTYPIYFKGDITDTTLADSIRTTATGNSSNGNFLSVLRNNTESTDVGSRYSNIFAFGTQDTQGIIGINYNNATVYVGGGSADKLNWIKQLAFSDHTHSNYLTAHQSLDGYVNTLSGTANSGVITNLTKSGKTITVTSTALTTADPSASGTSATFIASISQAANGKITATKKTVRTMGAATSSAAGSTGLVPAPSAGSQGKFLRGDGTWASPTDNNTNYYHTTGSWSGLTYTATANGGAGALAFTIPTGTTSTTVALGNHTHTAQTTITGNAGTATKFASAQSVTLTGDVTGTSSSQAGWSIAATLANSGVTAGSYGPNANATPAHSGTFSVPYITVDAKGRVTSASTKTITLPADNNTDTKVRQTLYSSNYNLPILMGYSTNTSTTTNVDNVAFRNNSIYANPSTGVIASTSIKIAEAVSLEYDSTNKCLNFNFA